MVEIDLFTTEKDGKGEFLGLYKVNVSEIAGQGEVDAWYTLQKRTKKSNVSGKIHLRLLYTVVDKQDAFINITSISDIKTKSMMYVKIKFGSSKTKTLSHQSSPDAQPSLDLSHDEAIVLPFDETESAIKFYLIDQSNRRSKLGVAQVLVSDLKHDEITEITTSFMSTKKKDLKIGEMALRVSIGDDLEAMEEATRASQAALDKKRKKKDKRSSKKASKSSRKSMDSEAQSEGEFDSDDSLTESNFSASDSESDSDFDSHRKSMDGRKSVDGRKSIDNRKTSSEYGNAPSPRGGFQAKEDLWPDQEDEDSYMRYVKISSNKTEIVKRKE